MKRVIIILITAFYASSVLAYSTLPAPAPSPTSSTPSVVYRTTSPPANSTLLEDVVEATNRTRLFDEVIQNTVNASERAKLLDEVIENTNAIKIIPSNQIGQQLVTQAELSSTAALSGYAMGAAGLAGLAYYQRTGKDPVYAAATSIASAADALFVPAYQAFKANFVSPESFPASAAQYVGEEGSVGCTLSNLLDFVKSNNTSYPDLAAYLESHKLSNTYPDPSTFQTGQVISIKDNNYTINSNWSETSTVLVSNWQTGAYYAAPTYIIVDSHMSLYVPATGSPVLYWATDSYYTSQNKLAYKVYSRSLANTTNPAQIFPTPNYDFQSIKDSFAQANADQAIKDQLIKSVADMPSDQKITSADPNPSTVPAPQPSPITNNDVSNFFTANTTNVYNEYLNTVNNGGDVNTAQAAAELAKAQEEEAEKETEEKFNPLDANPFQNPYNPGPFDIPTRFTTFLSNVKSSGLFSFSSSFFNSLPGGGSPLLTIDGGQTFGSHIYDFSQAFSSGLPILKAVLLALFGFLSVRAVIMKR